MRNVRPLNCRVHQQKRDSPCGYLSFVFELLGSYLDPTGLSRRLHNQAKQVCKLACKRASADCSASVSPRRNVTRSVPFLKRRLARSITGRSGGLSEPWKTERAVRARIESLTVHQKNNGFFKSRYFLSKPQAWHIIAALCVAHIIKGAMRPCISSRFSVYLLRLDDMQFLQN